MNQDQRQDGNSSKTIRKFVFFGFALVGGFFLITEHRAHLFGILPFLLLAACPLMHLFGHSHGGHGGHGEKESGSGQRAGDKPAEPPEHRCH